MATKKFPQDYSRSANPSLSDRLLLANWLTGAASYIDIAQIRDLVAALVSGNPVPKPIAPGTALGAPADAAIRYAPAGSYPLPTSGSIVLTEPLNLLFWDKSQWTSMAIPLSESLLLKTD